MQLEWRPAPVGDFVRLIALQRAFLLLAMTLTEKLSSVSQASSTLEEAWDEFPEAVKGRRWRAAAPWLRPVKAARIPH